MSTNTNTRVQTIENAHPDDIRPGDHITWVYVSKIGSVTFKSYHEGVAHHRDEWGSWCTEDGVWIAGSEDEDEGTTITIRRHAQELPTEDGAVIVPADGCNRIEAGGAHKFTAETATWDAEDQSWIGLWRDDYGQRCRYIHGLTITPGTWKKADQ